MSRRTYHSAAQVSAVLLTSIALASPATAQDAWAINSLGNACHRIKVDTGAFVSSTSIAAVDYCHGLAQHPITGDIYLVGEAGGPGRSLFILDPATGSTVLIGNTGDAFAGLSFDATGTLYGITGDGGMASASLFTLDLTSAAPTFVLALGSSCDGECIGFNPNDGMMYHASGWTGSCTPTFDKIDLGTLTVTNIPMSGANQEEMAGLTFIGGEFIAGNINGDVYGVSATGLVTFRGPGSFTTYRGFVEIDTSIGTEVCAANSNSTGAAAHISGNGSDTAGPGEVIGLLATPVPDEMGIFFYGPNLIDVPFGNGHLCASGFIVRLNPPAVGISNEASTDLENSAFIAGQTVYFQYWFRDPAAGGAAFNTSYALEVMFQ